MLARRFAAEDFASGSAQNSAPSVLSFSALQWVKLVEWRVLGWRGEASPLVSRQAHATVANSLYRGLFDSPLNLKKL